MHVTPDDPLEAPLEWTVTRYCVDLSPDTSLPAAVAITLRHQSGAVRTLVFNDPRFEQFGPLRIPELEHILIRRTAERGWESAARWEVCDLLEDQHTLFWASSVEVSA